VDLDGPRVGGLDTTYIDYMSCTGTKISRTYQTVSFAWGDGKLDPGIGPHTFCASWTGQGEISTSSVYAFTTTANDEVRLSVGEPPIEVNACSH
jgi:PA14 domain